MVATVTEHILTELICPFPNLHFWYCWYFWYFWWETLLSKYFSPSCTLRSSPEHFLWKSYSGLPSLSSLSFLVARTPFKIEKVLLLQRVGTVVKLVLVLQTFPSTWHRCAFCLRMGIWKCPRCGAFWQNQNGRLHCMWRGFHQAWFYFSHLDIHWDWLPGFQYARLSHIKLSRVFTFWLLPWQSLAALIKCVRVPVSSFV